MTGPGYAGLTEKPGFHVAENKGYCVAVGPGYVLRSTVLRRLNLKMQLIDDGISCGSGPHDEIALFHPHWAEHGTDVVYLTAMVAPAANSARFIPSFKKACWIAGAKPKAGTISILTLGAWL